MATVIYKTGVRLSLGPGIPDSQHVELIGGDETGILSPDFFRDRRVRRKSQGDAGDQIWPATRALDVCDGCHLKDEVFQ